MHGNIALDALEAFIRPKMVLDAIDTRTLDSLLGDVADEIISEDQWDNGYDKGLKAGYADAKAEGST